MCVCVLLNNNDLVLWLIFVRVEMYITSFIKEQILIERKVFGLTETILYHHPP